MNFTTITQCRLCGCDDIERVLDFGSVPLANAYPKTQDERENIYPLSVAKCANCGHVQLEQTVAPEILFKDYLFASSDSPSLVRHLEGLGREILQRFGPDRILEIGCNDGPLLKRFLALRAHNVYGVEPAKHLAEKARESGAEIFNDYFSVSLAEQIREEHGPMRVICATNTFAHIDDIERLVTGIEYLLHRSGVFIFENAYLLDTVKNLYFDQVYHEHLQYYGIRPLIGFFRKFGLEIFDVEHLPTQGGSVRVYVKKIESTARPVSVIVTNYISVEERAFLYSGSTFDWFSQRIDDLASRFIDHIAVLKKQGATISCYGCPAKFTLLSHRFGMTKENIEYVVDDSPVKQGRFTPGLKIPIVSNAHFQANPTDYCVTTAWNMADAIIRQNPQYRGKWINPFQCAG